MVSRVLEKGDLLKSIENNEEWFHIFDSMELGKIKTLFSIRKGDFESYTKPKSRVIPIEGIRVFGITDYKKRSEIGRIILDGIISEMDIKATALDSEDQMMLSTKMEDGVSIESLYLGTIKYQDGSKEKFFVDNDYGICIERV